MELQPDVPVEVPPNLGGLEDVHPQPLPEPDPMNAVADEPPIEEEEEPPDPLLTKPQEEEAAIVDPKLPGLPCNSFYGVRRGKDGVQGCIFLLWEHCALVVEGCDEAEYQAFSNWIDAAHYVLSKSLSPVNKETHLPAPVQAPAPPNTDEPTSKDTPTPTAHNTPPLAAAGAQPEVPAPAPVPTAPKTKKRKRTHNKEGKTPRYWKQQFEEFQQFQDSKDKDDPNPTTAKRMAKFEKEQRTEYRFLKQGKETKMTQEKIHLLRSLHFDFQYDQLLQEDNHQWDQMLQQLQAHQKSAQQSTNHLVRQPTALKQWKHEQRLQFQHLQQGKRSSLTPDRIQKLNDAGFRFCPTVRTRTWDERLQQLEQFQQEHGHLDIPTNHAELGYWTSNIRRAYKHLQDGNPKKTGQFTPERAAQLQAMGFRFLVGKRKTGPIENKPWEEHFQQLVEFKRQFGHTVVPQHYPGLGRFVKTMRREFKLRMQGKRSTMTQEKVLKLADIGFVFDAQYRRGSKISTNDYTKIGGTKHPHGEQPQQHSTMQQQQQPGG